MGKSVSTYREELDTIISEWKEFSKTLREDEKVRFENLMKEAKRHVSSAQYQVNSNSIESVFISILLEHQKFIKRIERRLENERVDIGYLSRHEKEENGPLGKNQ